MIFLEDISEKKNWLFFHYTSNVVYQIDYTLTHDDELALESKHPAAVCVMILCSFVNTFINTKTNSFSRFSHLYFLFMSYLFWRIFFNSFHFLDLCIWMFCRNEMIKNITYGFTTSQFKIVIKEEIIENTVWCRLLHTSQTFLYENAYVCTKFTFIISTVPLLYIICFIYKMWEISIHTFSTFM